MKKIQILKSIKEHLNHYKKIKLWLNTMVIYLIVGYGTFIITAMLPMPFMAKLYVPIIIAVILSIITTAKFKESFVENEDERISKVKELLESQLEREKQEVAKLRAKIRNQKTEFMEINWVWEVNLADVKTSYSKVADYFCRSGDDHIEWGIRPEKINKGDQRVIGVLAVDYIAKIGVDLRNVLTQYDRVKGCIKYWLPEPTQIGTSDAAVRWIIQAVLEYKGGLGITKSNWFWNDEESARTVSPVWEKIKTEAYQESFNSKKLSEQFRNAILLEAKRRVEYFLRLKYNCHAYSVNREELENPQTLLEMVYSSTASLEHHKKNGS